MSICNVDKWNMLAPTFDAFEIPKIEEDDCLTLINNLKLITKDSSVLDVGCGAGRYAIAFAQVCHNVIGTDLSPQMIEYAKKRAGNMGISHVSFVCEDWDTISIQERNYQNQFDFVFAHMTPAIHNTETLMKMQACSKELVYVGTPYSYGNTLDGRCQTKTQFKQHKLFKFIWCRPNISRLMGTRQTTSNCIF